jgi:ABC-2 type transport system permease protein
MNKNSFKVIKSGGYSLLIIAISFLLIIMLNLVISVLPANIRQTDTSNSGMYTLTDESTGIIDSVASDVTIYHIVQSGNEDMTLVTLLNRYSSLNSHIKIKNVDPVNSPGFTTQYSDTELSENSLIFESEFRTKAVNYSLLYQYDLSQVSDQDYQQWYYAQMMGVGSSEPPAGTILVFSGENAITNALDYVASPIIPAIAIAGGHGDMPISASVRSSIEEMNMTVKDITILTEALDPAVYNTIIISSPSSVMSAEEITKLTDYVAAGGTLLVSSGFETTAGLEPLAAAYGLELSDSLICETDGYYYMYPYYIMTVPTATHEITSPLANMTLLAGDEVFMKQSETLPDGVTITPLLSTSAGAYSVTDPTTSIGRDENSESGPFLLGAAIEAGKGKVIWYAASLVGESFANFDEATGGTNSQLYLNSIKWLTDQKTTTIRTVPLTNTTIIVPTAAAAGWATVLIAIIPAAFIITGIVIFVARRKK